MYPYNPLYQFSMVLHAMAHYIFWGLVYLAIGLAVYALAYWVWHATRK